MDKKKDVASRRRAAVINLNSLNKIINEGDMASRTKNNLPVSSSLGSGQKIVKSIGGRNKNNIVPEKPRPDKDFLTTVNAKFIKIDIPEKGSFNAGLVELDDDHYVCVYRPNELKFVGCILDKNYKVVEKSYHKFNINKCADPRLIWTKDNQLLMIYSYIENDKYETEYMRGTVIMDNRSSGKFVEGTSFRISPAHMNSRQKNWMPFDYKGRIHVISSVCPHEVYEIDNNFNCKKVFETSWASPWKIQAHLRGNTNAVRLDDGNYLGTFHTAMINRQKHHYDNGVYLFSGEPPFKVLKCANRTYLPADAACEMPFRKANEIACIFPIGMVRKKDKIIISYGDNDSAVKIAEYKLQDLLNTMVSVHLEDMVC
jgi:predicted GH43/DUF377 family glycosyl hydrolase